MQLPTIPETMPQSRAWFWPWVGRSLFRILGWRIEGELPADKKLVLIAAPHTSNWDFVVGMAAMMTLKIKANWLGKHSIFIGPANRIFRSWGGIPVERSEAHNMVTNVASVFSERPKMWLAVAPEGTRKRIDKWHSGFWHIAKAADVPIQTIYFDFSRKVLGVGKRFTPGEDAQADIQSIRDYYKTVGIGKYRDNE